MMWNLLKILIDLILYPVIVVYLIFCRILQCFGLKKVAFDYRNDLVLITGSGNGLGRELALVFAQAGASLALWDIDDDGNRETQNQCLKILAQRNRSARVRTYNVDVTQSKSVYESGERVRRELGQVSILICNAGFVSGKSLFDEFDDEVERTFSVNSLSSIWLIKAFLPYMLDTNRGHVVFVASILGMHASHGPISYVASKHATVGLSRSLRMEIHATKPNSRVAVHCICPYLMKTKMFEPLIRRVTLKSIFPVVTPKYVAQQTISSVYWNREETVLPFHLKYVALFGELFLPRRLVEWLIFKVSTRRPLDFFPNRRVPSARRKTSFNVESDSMEKSYVCVD